MLEMNIMDFVKIVSSIIGIVTIWIYKRKIAQILEGLITSGESFEYEGVKNNDIENEIRTMMDRMIR